MIETIDNLYLLLPIHNLNFTNHWELKVDCAKCLKFSNESIPKKKYKDSLKCLSCTIKGINQLNKNNIIEKIVYNYEEIVPDVDVNLIDEINKLNSKFKNFTKSIKSISCKQSEIDCIILRQYCNFQNQDKLILFFEFLKNVDDLSHEYYYKTQISTICNKCLKKYQNRVKKYLKVLQATRLFDLVRKIKDLQTKNSGFFSYMFVGPYFLGEKTQEHNFRNDDQKRSILLKYYIQEYPVFKALIYAYPLEIENLYEISVNIGNKTQDIYNNIKHIIKQKLNEINFENLLPIGEILNKFILIGINEISLNYPNLKSQEIENISLIAAVESVQIEKIFPLLIDNSIEEIYLDSPQSIIYIDHQQFRRCRTNIKLNSNEIEAIKSILRISGKKRLDFSNPSLKTTIHNNFFNCRFSLDTTPINSAGFSLDIRKMNKLIFTLPELVGKGTLSSEIAGFLLFCIINRINITVTGETNTGKTTLINSLDLLVPKHFRKIYVEEAPESLDETDFNLHQLKYKVDPSLNDFSSSSKTREIYKLLHRNPDIVYLGEILRKEEAHAMFHCLSVGLRGFQTIHSKSIKSLINRWRYHFGIEPSCFNDLDIIVFLKRKIHGRFITEISEIEYIPPFTEIHPIYKLDNENNKWVLQNQIENFNIIKRLKLNDQEKDLVISQIAFFSKVIEYFALKREYNLDHQMLLFQNLIAFIFKKFESNFHINWSELERTWKKKFL